MGCPTNSMSIWGGCFTLISLVWFSKEGVTQKLGTKSFWQSALVRQTLLASITFRAGRQAYCKGHIKRLSNFKVFSNRTEKKKVIYIFLLQTMQSSHWYVTSSQRARIWGIIVLAFFFQILQNIYLLHIQPVIPLLVKRIYMHSNKSWHAQQKSRHLNISLGFLMNKACINVLLTYLFKKFRPSLI